MGYSEKSSGAINDSEPLSSQETTENKHIQTQELFFGIFAHELRTQFAGIIQACGYLRGEKSELYLSTIITISKSTLQVLDNMLATVKINAGKLTINPINETFLFSSWLSELIAPFELHSRMKGNVIQIFYGTGTDTLLINTDKVKLGQVLANLLSNAIKCCTRSTSIDIVANATESGLLIQVRNRGIQIPTEKQSHLFEPFYQLDNGLAGNGLGLFLSRIYTEALGGSIEVDCQADTAVFSILLPRSASY